jgi:hypothetical protein
MKFINRLQAVLTLGLLLSGVAISQAQTAFTYQGSLQQNGAPANGAYDFQFGLYANASGGSAVVAVTNLNINVAGGLFTTAIDFGNTFNGAIYWLDIAIRPNGNTGAFTSLSSRQAVSPSPYALYAPSAGSVTGVLAVSNFPPNVAFLNSNVVFTGTVTASNFFVNGTSLTNSTGTNGNYVFAYDTSIQLFQSASSTFQVIGFNNPAVQISGWTYSPAGPEYNAFYPPVTGLYQIQYQAELGGSGTAVRTASFIATVNGIEIPGSQAAVTLATNGVTSISKTFMARLTALQTFQLKFTADNLTVNLQPSGTAATRPSVSLSITQIN